MTTLIYATNVSLDGYIEDATAPSTGLRPTTTCSQLTPPC